MLINKQGILSSLILFGGVFFSSYLAIKSTVLQDSSRDNNQVVGVGYQLKDWQMSETGLLSSFITADKMLHYADGRSNFFAVKAQYFDPKRQEDPPWNISADLGRVSADNVWVQLEKNVQLQRAKSKNSAAMEANTDHLIYDRRLSQITTDAFVTMKEPDLGNVTTGNGLKINLNDNEIKLLNDVHTTYVNQLPLTVHSDELEVNYSTQEGIYQGNAVADQGTRHLTADHIHLIREPNLKKFSEIHAFGNAKKQAYIELIPKLGESLVKGTSDEIVYHPILQTLTFKGNVELDQTGKVYHGPLATYNLQTEMVNSPASTEGRVMMQLPPDEIATNEKEKT